MTVPPYEHSTGSIGVGAMIVFIALILVAAVASTIVINSVERLNQQSESTVVDIRNQLSKKIEVESLILSQPSCSAELWQHSGFTGWSITFTLGDYDNTAFLAAGATDNDASSIKVAYGCRIIMFGGDNFDGWEAHLDAGDHGLGAIVAAGGANDEVSSIKIRGFEVLGIMQPSSGSGDIHVEDVTWSLACQNGTKVDFDSEGIVESGSRLLDGTNTQGVEADFVAGEFITYGNYIKVPMIWMNCVPELGDRLELYIHVNEGDTTLVLINVQHLDRGMDMLFNP